MKSRTRRATRESEQPLHRTITTLSLSFAAAVVAGLFGPGAAAVAHASPAGPAGADGGGEPTVDRLIVPEISETRQPTTSDAFAVSDADLLLATDVPTQPIPVPLPLPLATGLVGLAGAALARKVLGKRLR